MPQDGNRSMPASKFIAGVILSLFFAVFLFSCGNITSNCPTAPSSIISWWDGSSVQGTNAMDRIYGGSANNGILSANVGITSGVFSHRNAFSFDGATTSISVPSSVNLNLAKTITISAWINSNVGSTSNTIQTILSKWGNQSNGFTSVSNWTAVNFAGASILNNSNFVGYEVLFLTDDMFILFQVITVLFTATSVAMTRQRLSLPLQVGQVWISLDRRR